MSRELPINVIAQILKFVRRNISTTALLKVVSHC